MTSVPVAANSTTGKRLLDALQNDLRSLSNEAKKKHQPIKEAAESGIVKLRSAATRCEDLRQALHMDSPELLEPFFMGCDSKMPKMVLISLTGIQRMITFEAVSPVAAINLINCLWNLMESGVEELKLLQTVTLLISTNSIVRGDNLAKGLALCFRLNFTKDQTTNNTASATVRQIVTVIFDRAHRSSEAKEMDRAEGQDQAINLEELKQGSRYPPKSLHEAAGDAFLLFQDLVQLVNADQPFWLIGLTEMTRTFGLELLESIFVHYPEIFFKHEEFSFLLKERVCPLIIKLFSPNIKYKHQLTSIIGPSANQANQSQGNQGSLNSTDKPFYPISMRLLRIVNVLIQKFYTMLITESEIFLSLLIKFLDNEKPSWQQAVALEVLHKMCNQPNLLRSFCLFYDMKPHSSKIFRDIVTALGIYVQSQFISPPITPSLLSSLINAASSTGTSGSVSANGPQMMANSPKNQLSPQPSFLFRGTWIPILFTLNLGQVKSHFLEQLEKIDVPIIPDGYGLTIAYHAILELTRSLVIIIDGSAIALDINEKQPPTSDRTKSKVLQLESLTRETKALHESLLASSWCGLLASYSLLLDSSTDETVTDTILKHMEVLASFYGIYGLDAAREAFMIAICRSSLPAGYHLPLLTFTLPSSCGSDVSESNNATISELAGADMSYPTGSTLASNAAVLQQQLQTNTNAYVNGSAQVETSELRQQVVAVGTALPTSQPVTGSLQGPVMLTAKNLQCMRTLLTVAHCHGWVLHETWQVVLTTLQHLVWILGLKPSAGGSFMPSRSNADTNASASSMITTAAMSDLPVLTAMLSRMFESSQDLDDAGLVHLVHALCKLSSDSMEVALTNREPSLFAVAKILETGLVNIHRIDVIWDILTVHLLQVTRHPHSKIREWGAEAITVLVKTVLTNEVSNDETSQRKQLYLTPLRDLSSNPHSDIRQKQLDACSQIVQSRGEVLGNGWPSVLHIVSALHENHSENLIRLAFQSLQSIVSDFMQTIPPSSLVIVIDSTAKFGVQQQELNVALTAVGSLWNIADFIFQNQEKIKTCLSQDSNELNTSSTLPAFECLYMNLFSKLGELCTDNRPALRKSASQTLFATLQTHGTVLESSSWQHVLNQVLFPLLERVKQHSMSASNVKITDSSSKSMGISGPSGSILLHHSRNTAQKQWSETQVITLSGVSRLFNLKCDQFVASVPYFTNSWKTLLSYIEFGATSRNSEVSLSSLKSFQDVLCASPSVDLSITNPDDRIRLLETKHQLFLEAWESWIRIASQCTHPPGENDVVDLASINKINSDDLHTFQIPSQAFLAALVQIYPFLFRHIKAKFTVTDYEKLSNVLHGALAVPVDIATQAYLMSASTGVEHIGHSNSLQNPNTVLTPLQEAITFVLETFMNEILASNNPEVGQHIQPLLPPIFRTLLTFVTFASVPPLYGKCGPSTAQRGLVDLHAMAYVPFGERCLRLVVNLYQQVTTRTNVIRENVLNSIIKTFRG
ncbi:Protein MON2 -like protein [Halotydeus destructor]|nr:Protein MON2 -like protein [Halotydeus destructor]